MHTFTAQVLSCGMEGEHFGLVLDRTAFFPEGGGQCADTGVLIESGRRPGTGAGRRRRTGRSSMTDQGGGVRHGRTGRTGLGTAVFPNYAAAHGEHIVPAGACRLRL